jgi:anti-sigma factor RsiW
MTCALLRRNLSAYRDGELSGARSEAVAAHLRICPTCADLWHRLETSLAVLADSPPLAARERIATAVLDRLEVETRGPGLALLFRAPWAARPLMLPSLLHASLLVATLLMSALAIDSWHVRGDRDAYRVVVARAEALRTARQTPVRKLRGSAALAVSSAGADGFFVETLIGPGGNVLDVRLIGGDTARAAPLIHAMRQERFEPAPERGAALSIYQLISATDVYGTTLPSDL